MLNLAARFTTAALLCLCLTACITRRDQVLAPDARGFVIHARTGQPVEGARVRFAGLDATPTAITAADGAFTLDGRTRSRLTIANPLGGLHRDSTPIQISAPGLADAYASAGFINGGRPTRTLYSVPVLMFPVDAPETPLHALTRDCLVGPQRHHALHLVGSIAGIDPNRPPDWLNGGTAEALRDHLSRVLPYEDFRACEQADQAWALYRTARAPLEDVIASRQSEPW
jgi:hypothetical protein